MMRIKFTGILSGAIFVYKSKMFISDDGSLEPGHIKEKKIISIDCETDSKTTIAVTPRAARELATELIKLADEVEGSE